MKRAIIFIILLVSLLAFTWTALAQGGYDLSWFTVDDGGGVSSGGGYTLSGAIGQADMGVLMSGGDYTLAGGFWGVGGSVGGSRSNIYLPLIFK